MVTMARVLRTLISQRGDKVHCSSTPGKLFIGVVRQFMLVINPSENNWLIIVLNYSIVFVSQANNELSLAKKMTEWQPWEPLQTEAPPDQWKWPIGKLT